MQTPTFFVVLVFYQFYVNVPNLAQADKLRGNKNEIHMFHLFWQFSRPVQYYTQRANKVGEKNKGLKN